MSHNTRIQRKNKKADSPAPDINRRLAPPSSQATHAHPAAIHDALSAEGQPLDAATHEQMSPLFGYDFGQVRVHSDDRAARSAQALDAHAYTVGQHLVFGPGEYTPASDAGQRLIAHELAHVVQQSSGPAYGPQTANALKISHPTDPHEQAAEEAADQVMAARDRSPFTWPAPAPSIPHQGEAHALGSPVLDSIQDHTYGQHNASVTPLAPPERRAVTFEPPTIQRKAIGDRQPASLEDAVTQVQEELSDGDAEREQVEPVEAAVEVALQPPSDDAAGADGGGAGGAAPPPPADEKGAALGQKLDEAKPAPPQVAVPPVEKVNLPALATEKAEPAVKPEALAVVPKGPPPAVPSAPGIRPAPASVLPAAPPAAPPVLAPDGVNEPGADVKPAPDLASAAPTPAETPTRAAPPTLAPDGANESGADVKPTPDVAGAAPTPAEALTRTAPPVPGTEQPAPPPTGAENLAAPSPAVAQAPGAEAEPSMREAAPAAPQDNGTVAPAMPQGEKGPRGAPAPEEPQRKSEAPQEPQPGGAGPAPGGPQRPAAGPAAAAPADKAPSSPGEDPAFQAVVGNSRAVATGAQAHAPAAAESTKAQAAADPKGADVAMAAQDRHVGELQAQPPGVFDAAAFKAQVMEKIAQSAPQNLKEADEFKQNNKLGAVKGDLSGKVKDEQEQAAGPIEEKAEQPPNESGINAKPVQPLAPADAGPPPPAIGGAAAAPKPRPDAQVSAPLQQNSRELDQQMASASITDDQLAKSNEPSFNKALGAKNEAQDDAAKAPAQFRQQEGAALAQAQDQAEATADQKAAAMRQERTQLLAQVFGVQGETKTADEVERRKVAEDVTGIYQKTKEDVGRILSDLDGWVAGEFDRGAEAAKQIFENHVDQRMTDYKLKRYLGDPVFGAAKWLKDQFLGLPDEVNVFYQEGRQKFLDAMDGTLTQIANHVAAELNRAKARVGQGRQEIQDYVAKLPASLQQVGQQAAGQIAGKFDELEQNVEDKQSELVDTLAEKYNQKLQEVDTRIDEMKRENGGLVNKAKEAIAGVIQTIMELKAMLEGVLARAGAAIMAILNDPIGFLGNLIEGVKMGFMSFVGNIGAHLQKGLLDWLTGSVSAAGIKMPERLDLPGIFSLVLQILGLTYEHIRGQVVKALGPKGEQAVSALEKAWEIFQIIQKEGLAGLWEYVKDIVGDLQAMVIDEIKRLIAEEVIKAGVQWLIGLLGGPAGAFVKAAQAIIKIVMWFVENGSRLMGLVNSIIDGVTAIAGGALGQAAKFVEDALARTLPLTISFLADLIGLGGIADRVKDVIAFVRRPINKAIEWIIKKAKALVKKIGGMFGKGEEEDRDGSDERTSEEKRKDLDSALDEADKLMLAEDATPESVSAALPEIKNRYRLVTLELDEKDDKYLVRGELNPKNATPPRVLVESIEELVAEAPPEVRGRLIDAVRSAQDSQKKTMIVRDLIRGSGLIIRNRRNAAIAQTEEGVTITVSSYGQLEQWQKDAVKEAMGVELSRDIEAVEAFYEAHKEEFEQYGYVPGGHPADRVDIDPVRRGLHRLTHAEKQAAIVSGATALGVSENVCPPDCLPFFYALAKITGEAYTIADPEGTYVFYANGTVNFLPHNLEEV